jgi:hypothetical protein
MADATASPPSAPTVPIAVTPQQARRQHPGADRRVDNRLAADILIARSPWAAAALITGWRAGSRERLVG